MKTAEQWAAAWQDDARHIRGFRGETTVQGLLADYRRLENRHRTLIAIATRYVELYGAGGPEASFDTLYDKAVAALEQAQADFPDACPYCGRPGNGEPCAPHCAPREG